MSENKIIVGAGEVFGKVMVFSEKAACSDGLDIVLDAGARADVTLIVLPGASVSSRFSIELAGADADCRLSGIYLCPDGEKVDIRVDMKHLVPQCTSCQTFKGIVSGFSSVNFYGKITVEPGSQKTEAYQANHSLLLSDTAKVHTEPQLEIYADDVKCSHGATVGKLNEDEQFYMRTRGISLEDAKVLQMISFVAPVLDGIADEEQRMKLHEEIENAIRNGFGK